MAERWLPVPGFRRFYEISNLGRVRSLNRPGVWECHPGIVSHFVRKGRILKPKIHDGYQIVELYRPQGHATFAVHRLVLMAFMGRSLRGQEGRHLNGNRGDSRLKNLTWGTRKENSADALIHGTLRRGENHGYAKLTDKKVNEIRRRRKSFPRPTFKELGTIFGTSKGNIHVICAGRTWRHILPGT